MKKIILACAFALPIFLMNPGFCQSNDASKTILSNSWVKKYKKLKSDLEEKAAVVKNMENLSEADLKSIEKSYKKTSKMLEEWLDHLIIALETGNKETINQLSEGSIDPVLKEELLVIYTIYANEFSTRYEEITGLEGKTVLSHNRLMADGNSESSDLNLVNKFDRSFLIATVKDPLTPSDWKAIY